MKDFFPRKRALERDFPTIDTVHIASLSTNPCITEISRKNRGYGFNACHDNPVSDELLKTQENPWMEL
jgi:hypothetical protein